MASEPGCALHVWSDNVLKNCTLVPNKHWVLCFRIRVFQNTNRHKIDLRVMLCRHRKTKEEMTEEIVDGNQYSVASWSNSLFAPLTSGYRRHYVEPCKRGDDWGRIQLECIDEADDFWCLMEEVYDDSDEENGGFWFNRDFLLDAYKENLLFGLRVSETDSMYDRRARSDTIFVRRSFYLLPCLCIPKGEVVDIIWVHRRARRLGFGTLLVQRLGLFWFLFPKHKPIFHTRGRYRQAIYQFAVLEKFGF